MWRMVTESAKMVNKRLTAAHELETLPRLRSPIGTRTTFQCRMIHLESRNGDSPYLIYLPPLEANPSSAMIEPSKHGK